MHAHSLPFQLLVSKAGSVSFVRSWHLPTTKRCCSGPSFWLLRNCPRLPLCSIIISCGLPGDMEEPFGKVSEVRVREGLSFSCKQAWLLARSSLNTIMDCSEHRHCPALQVSSSMAQGHTHSVPQALSQRKIKLYSREKLG